QSSTDGAVCIAQAGRDALVVVFVDTVNIPILGAVGIEGVTNAELEAREVGGLIHDHVVPTDGVSRTEGSADVGLAEAGAEGAGYVSKVLGRDVGLAAQIQTAPAVALQADGGMTTKHT